MGDGSCWGLWCWLLGFIVGVVLAVCLNASLMAHADPHLMLQLAKQKEEDMFEIE